MEIGEPAYTLEVLRAAAFPQATARTKAGGAEGSRTPDLLIANETLYQLSYDPSRSKQRSLIWSNSGREQALSRVLCG